jgi:hypothetical protein
MGKASLIIAATVLAPIGLFYVSDALAARSAPPKMASEDCDERKGASLASATPSFEIRLPKPNIPKRKRRYIRM